MKYILLTLEGKRKLAGLLGLAPSSKYLLWPQHRTVWGLAKCPLSQWEDYRALSWVTLVGSRWLSGFHGHRTSAQITTVDDDVKKLNWSDRFTAACHNRANVAAAATLSATTTSNNRRLSVAHSVANEKRQLGAVGSMSGAHVRARPTCNRDSGSSPSVENVCPQWRSGQQTHMNIYNTTLYASI